MAQSGAFPPPLRQDKASVVAPLRSYAGRDDGQAAVPGGSAGASPHLFDVAERGRKVSLVRDATAFLVDE